MSALPLRVFRSDLGGIHLMTNEGQAAFDVISNVAVQVDATHLERLADAERHRDWALADRTRDEIGYRSLTLARLSEDEATALAYALLAATRSAVTA